MRRALELEPDNEEIKASIRNIRRANDLKEEATKLFKAANYQEAVQTFEKCLKIDEYNAPYNATIHLNLALALLKLKKNDLALASLNKALSFNPKYGKALVKRAEVHQLLSNHEEALSDFQAANNLDPSMDRLYGLTEKIRLAKQKAREAGKKDFYKILGVDKKASDDEIKKAYKKLAMKWHPDRNSQATEEEKAKADKMFKEINEAYTVLSDKEERRKFDLGGFDEEGGYFRQPQQSSGFSQPSGMYQSSGGPGVRTFVFSSSSMGGAPQGAGGIDLAQIFQMFGQSQRMGGFGDTDMRDESNPFAAFSGARAGSQQRRANQYS